MVALLNHSLPFPVLSKFYVIDILHFHTSFIRTCLYAASHGGGEQEGRQRKKMQQLSRWLKDQLENWQELKASFS